MNTMYTKAHYFFANFWLAPLSPASRAKVAYPILLATLILFPILAEAQLATFNLAWTPPATTTGITSYRIYVRPAGGTYPASFYTASGASTSSLVVTDLAPGSYVFKATSYNGTAESVASNEIAATAIAAPLEGGTTAQSSGTTFAITAFNPGQTTALVTATAVANANGVVTIPTGAAGLPTTFDLRVNAVRYLARKISNRSRTDATAFTSLPAGDLDDSGTVNSFDYGILKQNWLTASAVADINKDGVVNSFDYSYLKKNWFGTDDL